MHSLCPPIKDFEEMEYQVSDICTPNLLVHFDFEPMADMVETQGADKSIRTIMSSYCDMVKCDIERVINCNREIEDRPKLVGEN